MPKSLKEQVQDLLVRKHGLTIEDATLLAESELGEHYIGIADTTKSNADWAASAIANQASYADWRPKTEAE